MMREIKFRAWHRERENMASPMTLSFIACEEGWKLRGKAEEYEWMLYTGLKDKNGKEIYGGDMVNVLEQWINKKDDTDIVEQNPYNLQVVFVNYEWELINFAKNENGVVMPRQPIIKLPDYSEGFSWGNGLEIWGHNNFEYKQRFSEFEVIGNIYENPELLK